MLISRRHGQLQLITQPEHAALAGALAQAWGNARFETASASLVAVAARHDDGWTAIDSVPAVLSDQGRPAHFLEVDLPETIEPYGAGVDRIYADDAYAGTLASRHWAGLYSSRWGVQDGPPVGHPAAQAVVEAQEVRATREARALWGGMGLRSSFEAKLWRDYETLQALDLISLALCLVEIEAPTDGTAPPVAISATLRSLDQPPGARLIPNVPTAQAGHVTITVTMREPAVVVFDPYPLKAPRMGFVVTRRLLNDIRHENPAQAYHDAAQAALEFVVIPPYG
jgi:hypothetical protein